ncbi:MAG: LysR family transcriptional regulator ArgP [bacterium]|nr:LysR family transcriptional regulator ArgP [bacterium]
MLDYHLLDALLTVEREGSFEGAARVMGMTSSAVSQRIKLLEERIGAVILNRNPVGPSEFGSRLCRHVEQVKLLEETFIGANRRNFRAFDGHPVEIKIAVNDDSLSSWFLEVLQPCSQSDRCFLFDISLQDQDHSIEQMKSGVVLAAISSIKKPVQGFTSHYLGKHVYRATASPAFVRHYFKDGVTFDALKDAPSLRYNGHDDLQQQWLHQIFGKKHKLPSCMLPSSFGFVNACLKDVGWGMNPSSMVDHHIKAGELIELIPDATLDKILYWHVSRVVGDTLSKVTDKVRNVARKHLAQDQNAMSVKNLAKTG